MKNKYVDMPHPGRHTAMNSKKGILGYKCPWCNQKLPRETWQGLEEYYCKYCGQKLMNN